MEEDNNHSFIYTLNHLPKWNTSEKDEKKNTVKKTWSRLHKMQKTEKIIEYAHTLSEKEELTTDELNNLITYLKHLLDRKRLQNSKDIVYNVSESKIEDIPNLKFVQETGRKRFTLKKSDNSMTISKQILHRSKTMKKSLKKEQINTNIIENSIHGH